MSRQRFNRHSLIALVLLGALFLVPSLQASTYDMILLVLEKPIERSPLVVTRPIYCTFPTYNGMGFAKQGSNFKRVNRFILDGYVVDHDEAIKPGRRFFGDLRGGMMFGYSWEDGINEGFVMKVDSGKRSLTFMGCDITQLGRHAITVDVGDTAVITVNGKPVALKDLPLYADIDYMPAAPQRVEIYSKPTLSQSGAFPTKGNQSFEGIVLEAPTATACKIFDTHTGQPRDVALNPRKFSGILDCRKYGAAKQILVPGRRVYCAASGGRPPSFFLTFSNQDAVMNGTVKAVKGNEVTVEVQTVNGLEARTVSIDPDARITLDGKPADATALAVDKRVRLVTKRPQTLRCIAMKIPDDRETLLARVNAEDATVEAKRVKYAQAAAATALTRMATTDPSLIPSFLETMAGLKKNARYAHSPMMQLFFDNPEAVKVHPEKAGLAMASALRERGFQCDYAVMFLEQNPALLTPAVIEKIKEYQTRQHLGKLRARLGALIKKAESGSPGQG